MEIKAYLRILIRRWRFVVPTFLATFILTFLYTMQQPSEYRATATFVVRVGVAFIDDKNFVSALDTLSRRVEIASTYAEVASSRLVKERAAESLNLSPGQVGGISISSRLIPGTNILEVTVVGNNPVLVRNFANAVGRQTIAYVRNLYEAYEIEPLDEASQPGSPFRPNKGFTLALGAIFGLVLGTGFAFFVEYLQSPGEEKAYLNILDDETGMYNKRFFLLRLEQEISRAHRNNYQLSIVLMEVDPYGALDHISPPNRIELTRRIAAMAEPQLRDEDVIARFDDTIFAFLLPDKDGMAAKQLVEGIQAKLRTNSIELNGRGTHINVISIAGVADYQHQDKGQEEILVQARRALQDAGNKMNRKITLASELRNHSEADWQEGVNPRLDEFLSDR